MKDLQTGSIWSHLEGVGLRGPLTGTRMEIVPLVHATWEQWRSLHPDTLVLSEDTRWKRNYRSRRIGRSGLGGAFVRSLENWDGRLPEATLVLGVEADGIYVAYVLDVLKAHDSVVNDRVAGQDIVVWHTADASSASAYSRLVDGQVLDFRVSEGGDFIDATTGSTWNLQGLATGGRPAGTRLRFITSFITEWYGWAAHHPETEIYDYDMAMELIGPGNTAPGR